MAEHPSHEILEDILPLAPLQEGLLFHALSRDGGEDSYTIQLILDLEGDLDRSRLRDALQALLARHASLRAAFVTDAGPQPVQIIARQVEMPWIDLDLSTATATEQERAVADWLRQDRARPFDLQTPPLLRVALIALGGKRYRCVLTIHHLLIDGWSTPIVISEVMALYRHGRAAVDLPEVTPYREYLAWIAQQDRNAAIAAWREAFVGLEISPPLVEPPAAGVAACYEQHWLELSAEVTEGLRTQARTHGWTFNTVFQAAWGILLARLQRTSDVVFGHSVSGRPAEVAGIETMVGMFTNTLPVRLQVANGARLGAVIEQLHRRQTALLPHQFLGLGEIQRLVAVDDLFETSIAFQSYPVEQVPADGDAQTVRLTRVDGHDGVGHPLVVTVAPAQTVRVRFTFDAARISRDDLQTLVSAFERVLTACGGDLETCVADVDLLDAPARTQSLQALRGPSGTDRKSVLARFDEHVARAADAVAVVQGAAHLSYGRLDRDVDTLAAALAACDVEVEERVGVVLERGLDLPAALLAVWKSGATYVPVEPHVPVDRLQTILDTAGVRSVITRAHLERRLPPTIAHAICADNLRDAPPPVRGRSYHHRPSAAAYVIFTSGSSGQPKGVVIEHRGLPALATLHAAQLGVTSRSRILQFATPSVDASIWELVMTLANGATLIVIPDEARAGAALDAIAVQHAVTHLTVPPSVLATLPDEAPLPVEVAIVAGEACPGALVEQWAAGRTLVNAYGPSESTVCATTAVMHRGGRPSIGVPIVDTDAFVLDAALQPMPPGRVGELYLGGQLLARGYAGAPALTAARFVASPFDSAGRRLYRTGDLVRWRIDGGLEFVGREDEQVKLRGFRIELGEIESALRAHPAVAAAAASLVGEESQSRLIGYVVLHPDRDAAADTRDAHLNQWQAIFDVTNAQRDVAAGDFDITGWRSSYTGAALPSDEMAAWVDGTVTRLRACEAEHVLEIGCGTGLILSRLAPGVARYTGVDISGAVIRQLRNHLEQRPELSHVDVRQGRAHHLGFAQSASVDLVVLNSVAQYFPDVEYLFEVLGEAVRVTREGGRIFVGDVRDLRLVRAFYASVVWHRAAPGELLADLDARIDRLAEQEEELVIDPDLFTEQCAEWDRVSRVEVLPKTGDYDNELSRFRYDVIITIGEKQTPIPAPASRRILWDGAQSWQPQLENLRSASPGPVAIVGLPDARAAYWVALEEAISRNRRSIDTVADLRQRLQAPAAEHPSALIYWARRAGASLAWQRTMRPGVYDVIVDAAWRSTPSQRTITTSERPLVNAPMRPRSKVAIERVIMEALRQRLPDHLMPSAIVTLEELPRTASGKIDRKRLPAPIVSRLPLQPAFKPPRNPVEAILCELFAELLGVDRVGIDDDFFSLGGHSLAAVQLVGRVQLMLGVSVSLQALFDTPTVGALARVLDASPASADSLQRSERPEQLPLSFAQQRMWFLNRLDGPSYNMPTALRLDGLLDRLALEDAVNDVIARHESLRTLIVETDGVPRQEVRPADAARLSLSMVRIGELEMRAHIEREAAAPFALDRELPIRARLFRLADDRHLLLFVAHHIAADGWSIGVLWRDLAQAYAARRQGLAPEWTPLAVQYADYALWQRRALGDDRNVESRWSRELAFWKERLRGLPPAIDLPVDVARRTPGTGRADTVPIRLDAKVHAALAELGRDTQATLFMIVHAALAALLTRLGAGTDVSIGTIISGRDDAATEDVIGLFLNTLVLRADTSGDPTPVTLVERSRRTALDAYAHSHLPFERVVDALNAERVLGQHPLFQVALSVGSADQPLPRFDGLQATHESVTTPGAKFDLAIGLAERRAPDGAAGGIEGGITYATSLFERSTIERIARRLCRMLAAFAATPHQWLSAVDVLEDDERRELGGQMATAVGAPAIRRVEERAAAAPDRVAVVCSGHHVSYALLNARAAHLAVVLTQRGIRPHDRVAVALARSPELATALLAIWKIGACYVPLDPTHPVERLRFVIDDAAPACVVTSRAVSARLAAGVVVLVDGDEPQAAAPPGGVGTPAWSPLSPAYVMYTSGSTGPPKGVVVSHQAFAAFLDAMQDVMAFPPAHRHLAMTTAIFDISLLELLAPLCSGATVLIATDREARDSHQLATLINTTRPASLQATPAHWRIILERSDIDLDGLLAACGGDVLGIDLARALLARHCALINLYGPTEATVWATAHRVHESDVAGGSATDLPIGRPLSHDVVHVLDQRLSVVPPGTKGEIYIGGWGLANGYWRRAALTAERFVADPFGALGARLYRTGDLAKRRADGSVEFLGRADQQLKIRSHRVELGEVEAQLRELPGVRDAAAVAWDVPEGERRLTAYVAGDAALDGETLRRTLADRVPAHLVPAAIVVLDSLPMTANGKVDRAALPALPPAARLAPYRAPRTPAEQLLCRLVAQLVRIERAGLDDNFFALGGDSIVAIQLVSRAQSGGLTIEPRDLFLYASLEQLAAAGRWTGGDATPEAPRDENADVLSDLRRRLATGTIDRAAARELLAELQVALAGEPTAVSEAVSASSDLQESAGTSSRGAAFDRPLVEISESDRHALEVTQGPLDNILPLTPLQEGLLFHSLADPAGPDTYTAQVVLRIKGHLDVARLESAMQQLVRRHDSLRAAFVVSANLGALQLIHRAVSVPVRLVDLEHEPAQDRERRTDELKRGDREQRFDPSRPPMIRLTAIRLGPLDHRVVLTWHHLVFDGWSAALLVRELLDRHADQAAGGTLPAPSWRTFLAWLQRQDRDAAHAAWADALRGLETGTHLCSTRRVSLKARPAERYTELDEPLTRRLIEVARENGWTMNAVLQSAWALVLGRLAGTSDVVFGSVVSGRPPTLDGVETMVGLFINTVPVRVRLRPQATLSSLIAGVQHAHGALLPYHHVGLSQIQRLVRVDDLFDTSFVFENYPGAPATSAGSALSIDVERGHDATHYPLHLAVLLRRTLELRFVYRPDLLDAAWIDELGERLRGVLRSIVTDTGQCLANVDVLTERERELLTRRDTPPGAPASTVPELLRRSVAANPDAIALVDDRRHFSYACVWERAGAMATGLRSAGAGPGQLVGLALERRAELVIGLVAILHSGATAVPLDPAYPAQRLRLMLEDAAPVCVLTSGDVDAGWSAGTPLVLIETLDAVATMPPATIVPAQVAYILYTSGSTGRPKGVALTHRNAATFLLWAQSAFAREQWRRVLASTSICFDLSIFELLGTLTAGGTIVLVPNGMQLDGRPEVDSVTLINTVPSVMASLLQAGRLPRSAIAVNLAGEALSRSLVDALFQAGIGRVANLYGPTEATTYATMATLGQGDAAPSIGSPISPTTVRVLDHALAPAPIGSPGELYIAGPCVADGYWRRPALTAERFVANPLGPAGSRWYRTGDIGYRRDDGALEFMGRRDLQVKLRGFRIELGEIDATLHRHPAVADAAATVSSTSGDARLSVFVSPKPGMELDVDELRAWMRRVLPAHMVPASIVVTTVMPRTASGKIDRAALQVPISAPLAASSPRSAVERLLCDLFADVLAVPSVGRDDNFFDAGGHSLSAMRLASRIRETFKVDYTLPMLFETPTVAAVAQQLAGARARSVPAGALTRPPVLPLSYTQQRLWFVHHLHPDSSHYHIGAAMRLRGTIDHLTLESALNDAIDRHEALRTRFSDRDGVPYQEVLPEGAVRLDLSPVSIAPDQLHAGLSTESARAFRFDAGPPLRAKLFRLADNEHVLIIVAHHIAADGWSMRTIWREMFESYRARAAGGRPDWLPPVQYPDYTLHQRQALGDEEDPSSVLARQLAYWRTALAELPVMTLPTDHPRGPASAAGASVHLAIGAAEHARLLASCQARQATLFMAMHAALAALLTRVGAGDDVAIGTPIAGRNAPALEAAVGCFVNTVVLRIDTSGNPSFGDLLDRVRRVALSAFEHSDVPLERVVEAISPERAVDRHPLYQVTLAVDRAAADEFVLPGVESRPVPIDLDAVRGDLLVSVTERRRPDGTPDGIEGAFTYRTDLFERDTVERLVQYFKQMLSAMAESAASRLDRVELSSPALVTDASLADVVPDAHSISALYEARAAEMPDAIAFVHDSGHLSYAVADAEANRLARLLIDDGARPESRVAVVLTRGMRLPIAMLAVWKAGATLVLVDPALPAARLLRIVADALPRIIMNIGASLTGMEGDGRVLDVTTPSITARLTALPVTAPTRASGGAHAAYVIYTSGSTGHPKGVVVEHRQLMAYATALHDRAGSLPGARFAALQSFAFDFALTTFVASIACGGTLHIVAESVVAMADALVSYLDTRALDYVKLTPSHLIALQAATGRTVLGKGTLILGGESAHRKWVADLHAAAPATTIFNHYGPTETTVGVIMEPVVLDDAEGPYIPLGRPLPGVRASVLDRFGSSAPIGVAGELYIAGTQVARGYLHLPALTASRFVADPFGPAGSRMYRTGDLVKRRRDGRLAFIGRADRQVKIHGYRIEPAEIEAALLSYPNVAQAVVTCNSDTSKPSICAYVVPDGHAVVSEIGSPEGLSHDNRLEARFLWKEIVEQQIYLKQGVTLTPDSCVVDVGAHVGVFTIFAAGRVPRGRVVALEPVESLWERLRQNTSHLGDRVRVLPLGASDRERTVEFTYYPQLSVMSGQREYANAADDFNFLKKSLRRRADAGDATAAQLLTEGDGWLPSTAQARVVQSRVTRLSDIIRSERLDRIDLLKIDAQRAEWDVLQGIDEEHWARIGQVVVEVHDRVLDRRNLVDMVAAFLKAHGYDVSLGSDDTEMPVRIVYATRAHWFRHSQEAHSAAVVPFDVASLHQHLTDLLPRYMVPAQIVAIDRMPLSPHGKVDHGSLPSPQPVSGVTHRPPRTKAEAIVCEQIAGLLKLPSVGLDDNFFALGGDSMISIQLVSRLRKAGLSVTPRDIFLHQTIEQLAAAAAPVPAPGDGGRSSASDGAGRIPLTPIMKSILGVGVPRGEYCHTVLVQLPDAVDRHSLCQTLQALLDCHDTLRLQVLPVGDGTWALEARARDSVRAQAIFEHVSLATSSSAARTRRLRQVAQRTMRSLDPVAGVMIRAVWFESAAEPRNQLLLVVHHLAVDAVSWPLLIADLKAAWSDAWSGRAASLASPPVSFREWARRLAADAVSPSRRAELPHWERTAQAARLLTSAPLDPALDTVATARRCRVTLGTELTQALLTSAAAAWHAGVDELLLCALAMTAEQQWPRRTEADGIVIDLEGHGRDQPLDGLDVSRTVGWFTQTYPVRLDLTGIDCDTDDAASLGRCVRQVKESLRAVPGRGIGFGLLRHLNPDTGERLTYDPFIRFNYLGRADLGAAPGEWALVPGTTIGGSRDRRTPLSYPLDIVARVAAGPKGPQLSAHWIAAPTVITSAQLRGLARTWRRSIERLIRHVRGGAVAGLVPSDAPLVALTHDELAHLQRLARDIE